MRAINKTIRSLEVLLAREVGDDVGIAARFLRERMTAERASLRKMRGRLLERVAGMPAHIFGSVQTALGVRAGKTFFRSAFHADLGTGQGRAVYMRVGRQRFPVKKQFVNIEEPSRRAIERIAARTWELFVKNFDHELKYLMGYFG
jgi:hypothetical protein